MLFFTPPTVSETVEALATAEVVDGVIIENRPLTELRRSFAALFVFDEYLSLKAGGRQSPGELNALMDAYRLGPDTIREICAGDSVEELKRAWMRWVLTAYKFETARRLPIENKSAASDLRLRASWLFSVLLTAFDIERILEPNFKEALSPLAHFLSSTLFERECDADGDLKSEVSEILSFFLLETIKGDTKDDERIGRALVTRYLDLLPKGLSDKILENTDIAGVTGYQQTVSFEGLRFSSEAFWEAAAQEVRRRDTVACASIDTEEVKISSVDQGIIVTAYGKKFRIDEPALRCLKYKSLDERRRHTAAELMQLGVPPKKSKRLALELSKEKKLSDYVFKFHDLISSNFQSTLSNLSNAAQSDDRLSLELFRPPLVDDLTDYLGFDEGALSFDEAASVLLKAVGVKEAVRRWLLLPVKLPSPLVDAYRREPEVRRNELLNGLTEQMCAPASLINLQMLSISSVCEDKTQLLRNRKFIHGATTNIPALYGLLSWNDACLRRSIGPKHWFHDLACWLWAGSVLEIFSINSSDISSLGEFLKEREPRGPAELPEILRIESQLNVRGYSDLSLSAVLIQAYGFDNIVSRDSNGLEKLKDYFRHDTTKEYPKISVFKLPHKKSDIEETWLSNRPTWVARAFETADGFVESALSEPENKAKDFSRKSKLSSDSKDSYFATLSLLAPYIDELGWKKIAQQLSRYRKKAGIKEIHTISRIIVNAPLNVSERLLEEFACRLSAIGPAENGATEAALAILESAVTASVRQPGDWAATFLPLAKALCRHLQDGFPMECVAVLDLSRWALPSASREELWRLRLDVAFLSDKRWHLTYLQ